MARPLNILATFLVITLLAGCGKDRPRSMAGPGGSSGGATSATFSGAYVNGGEFGSITLTIDYTNSILGAAGTQYAVTGYFVPDGQDTIPLDGLYVPRVGGLSASDSGYTFSGAHSVVNGSETIDGIWAGPNGSSGWFGTSCATAQHQTAAYAGTYDGGGGGWVVLLATDSALRGRWYPYFGTPLAVYGSLGSGTTTTRNITLTSGAPNVLFNASGSLTVSSQDMQGIWRRFNNFDPAGSGTWKAAHIP